jgi:xanthine dehydrogenase accessory factor
VTKLSSMVPDKTQAGTNLGDRIRKLLDDGETATLVTVLSSTALTVGAKLLIKEDNQSIGDLGDARLNETVVEHAAAFINGRDETKAVKLSEIAPQLKSVADTLLLFERLQSEPRLIIAGAGHVGAALARLAALAGYEVTLIDDRPEFVLREFFPSRSEEGIKLITAEGWSESLRDAIGGGRGVSVAIVTRGHKQDEDCLRATIAAGPDYIGMIGSKRRTNIVLDKLREEGFGSEQLSKIRAPIGLDIGAVSPEEVALAILAEIILERRGGSGAPLSIWRRN